MTDLLIAVLLTGFAVTYILELLDLSIIGAWLGKSTINIVFALPLSFGGMYVFFGLTTQHLISVPATTFISLALGKYLNKPAVVSQRLQRL